MLADDGVRVNGVLEKPPVRFLGVWDVVAAFGIPINLGFNFNRINLGYKLGLSKGVKYCYHALALDEARQAFRPTRLQGGCEVWFRGVHSDVGGGNNNHALNDITLRWMLRIRPWPAWSRRDLDRIEKNCTRIDVEGKISGNFDPIHNRPREPKRRRPVSLHGGDAPGTRESAGSVHARDRSIRRPDPGRPHERSRRMDECSQRLRQIPAGGTPRSQAALRREGARRPLRVRAGHFRRRHPLGLVRARRHPDLPQREARQRARGFERNLLRPLRLHVHGFRRRLHRQRGLLASSINFGKGGNWRTYLGASNLGARSAEFQADGVEGVDGSKFTWLDFFRQHGNYLKPSSMSTMSLVGGRCAAC